MGVLGGGIGGWESWEEACWEEGLEAESPGDWSLGGRIVSWEDRLEAGSLVIRRGKIGGLESLEEGLEAGREEGFEWEWIGGWESWNPGRRDWRLGILGGGLLGGGIGG